MFIEKTPSNNSQDLKTIRENLGLSLEDLFQRTRVRVVYLQAIENKEFDLLPVPVYSKNFIKIYAGALGIDSEPLMKEYEDYLNSRKDMPAPVEENEEEKFSLAKIIGKKTYLVIAFILIAVIVIHWLISKKNEAALETVNPVGIKTASVQENKAQGANIAISQQLPPAPVAGQQEDVTQPVVEKKSIELKEQKESVTPPLKVLSQPANMPNSSDKDALLLIVKATQETWLRVKAEENPSFQVLLKAGDKFERKARSFEIDIGNAGGVNVNFNGKDFGNLGKTGQVVHLRLQ